MALPDGIADIVCSNCVINLVPETEKPAVFHEIFRILKPGGRVAISDVLTKQPLPEIIRKNPAMLVGCISGASMPSEYEKWMLDAGFKGESCRPYDHKPGADSRLQILFSLTPRTISTYFWILNS
jgi:arsenite methyltransferase